MGIINHRLDSLEKALQELSTLGISFERAIHCPVTYGVGPHIGPIIYFMVGDCDVAYYVRDIALTVHSTPREWREEILKEYSIYPLTGTQSPLELLL